MASTRSRLSVAGSERETSTRCLEPDGAGHHSALKGAAGSSPEAVQLLVFPVCATTGAGVTDLFELTTYPDTSPRSTTPSATKRSSHSFD